jgi:sugar phosphate permease
MVTRFDVTERSIVTGWVGTSRNLGKAMAPMIMGLIIAGTDLRTTFIIVGVLALAVAPTSRSFRAT